jgi:predicted RNA methylase
MRTLRWCTYSVAWRYQEWKLGISTNAWMPQQALGYGPEQCGYEPIDYSCLDDALATVAERAAHEVLLDYGCGKGRTLVAAGMRGFRRVVGVELTPELALMAKRNLRRASERLRCHDIEIVIADAREYTIPDDVTVIVLFNPFRGKVLDETLERILESLQRTPRRIFIVHTVPLSDPEPLGDLSWLHEIERPPTGYWDHVKTIVYESTYSSSPTPVRR